MQARFSTATALGGGLLTALAACGGGTPEASPAWVELARGFEPTPLLQTVTAWQAADSPGTQVRADENGEGVWVETKLPPAVWTPDELPGLWWTPRPSTDAFQVAQGPLRLSQGERVFARGLATDEPTAGTFVLSEGRIGLFVGQGQDPPEGILFAIQVRDGLAVEDVWRVRTGDHVGAGIPVWTGHAESVELELRDDSVLHFMTYYAPTLPELAPGEPIASFQISLNGETIWSQDQGPGLDSHELRLPLKGMESARLRLSVEGAPGLGVFFDPVQGPEAHGHYGDRPWGKTRPNLVLFLADTFRADNLEAYGGRPEVAPNLNAFAERSMRFTRTRSTAAWTLPALGTLFSGYLPGQHGATDIGTALPRDLDTIAELLQRRGYRTAAITDSGFFTMAFGLDQGFSWFEENQNADWDLDHTLEEALRFLDQDDGRPVFLVVHTYRTHAPFRQGSEEDDAAWEQLMAEAFAMLDERRGQGAKGDLKREVLLTFRDRLEALYRGGVGHLDEGFGRFLGELETRHVLDDGVLVFTSDHGEALGENDDMLHGGRLWDVKLRVPLLVHGPRFAPQDVGWAATLADLPSTFAWLAGLPIPDDWAGTSLVTLAEERPQLAYQLEKNNRELAIHDHDRKLLTDPDPERLARGEVDAAFDLNLDPRESKDCSQEDWAAELARRLAERVAFTLEPVTDPATVQAAPEALRDLQKIGYDGDE